jgi:hypothetical protein
MLSLTRTRRIHSADTPSYPLDVARSRFPFSIVWCPLPGITSFLPVVGHMGLCDSRGVVMDFAGPYCISVDEMSFSRPYLYYTLDPALARKRLPGQTPAAAWDAGVDAGCDEYCGRMHNMCVPLPYCPIGAAALFLLRVARSSLSNTHYFFLCVCLCASGRMRHHGVK